MKSISVHLTDQCNNSCIFCVVNSSREKREGVRKNVLYNFLKENAGKGYESVNIHGGEPTVVENFLEVLQTIKDLGYPMVSIQTNARRLADMDFAEKVCNLGVKLFVVSVHGENAEQHDAITQVDGSFEEAIQGIKNVKALGAKVRTNTVVYKGNYNSLETIANMLIDIGVDHINISGVHPVGKAYENFHQVTPKYTDIVEKVFRMVDVCRERNKVVTLEGFPHCMIPGYEKYIVDWEENHFKLLFHNFILDDYAAFMETETKRHGDVCSDCKNHEACGGVYKEYLEFYDWDEFKNLKR